MSSEQEFRPTPFRIEVKPMMDGANPYQESKFKGNTRELNHRAVLKETVYLYEGNVENRKLGRKSGAEVKGFMEIRNHFFPDRQQVYHPFFYWGLKDGETNKSYDGYGDSTTYIDPIHIFRVVKVLEALPRLGKGKDQTRRDNLDSLMATEQGGLEDFAYRYLNSNGTTFTNARKRISDLIGQDRLDEILDIVPSDLPTMMQTIKENGLDIDTRTLKREIDLGKIPSSKFYQEAIEDHDREIQKLARGLEESGGRWQ